MITYRSCQGRAHFRCESDRELTIENGEMCQKHEGLCSEGKQYIKSKRNLKYRSYNETDRVVIKILLTFSLSNGIQHFAHYSLV